jgi:hypothetical protein
MRYNAAIEAAAARLAGLRPEEVCARTGAVFANKDMGTRVDAGADMGAGWGGEYLIDRKSTRLNSSHPH